MQRKIINCIVIIMGSFFLLWGVVCFLGGPQGDFGSPESILIGFICFGTGCLLVFFKKEIIRYLTEYE